MQLNADLKDGKYTLKLSGAPSGSVVEVRFQNTFTGGNDVYTADVKSDGTAVVEPPRNFGQNFKVDLVVLTDEGDNTHPLVYAPAAKGDRSGNFVLVTADSPLLKQAQPTATAARVASVPAQPA